MVVSCDFKLVLMVCLEEYSTTVVDFVLCFCVWNRDWKWYRSWKQILCKCMDQEVGDQHKMKALWGHFGTLQHGISYFQLVQLTACGVKVFAGKAENMEFALQSSICRFEVFLQNCRRGGGWAWMLADSKPCDWGYVRKIISHMAWMGWWTSNE